MEPKWSPKLSKKQPRNRSVNRVLRTFETEVGGGPRRLVIRGSAAVAVLDTAKLKNGVYGENSGFGIQDAMYPEGTADDGKRAMSFSSAQRPF